MTTPAIKSRLTISFLSYDERLGKALVLAEKSVQLYRDLACLSGLRSLKNRQQLAQARAKTSQRASVGRHAVVPEPSARYILRRLIQATQRRWASTEQTQDRELDYDARDFPSSMCASDSGYTQAAMIAWRIEEVLARMGKSVKERPGTSRIKQQNSFVISPLLRRLRFVPLVVADDSPTSRLTLADTRFRSAIATAYGVLHGEQQ